MLSILRKQIPLLGPKADFATLTISGNDVGFPNLLNACVYRFVGWQSGVCEDEIRRTQDLIDGDALGGQIWYILGNVTAKGLNQVPTFHLFMTGYAAFFNEDTTQCDGVTFRHCAVPVPLCWFDTAPMLTRELRRNLNRLVTNLQHPACGYC